MDRGKVSAAEENWRARMQHLHFAAPVPAARLACVVSAAATAPRRFGRGKGRRDWADGARRAAGAMRTAVTGPYTVLYIHTARTVQTQRSRLIFRVTLCCTGVGASVAGGVTPFLAGGGGAYAYRACQRPGAMGDEAGGSFRFVVGPLPSPPTPAC